MAEAQTMSARIAAEVAALLQAVAPPDIQVRGRDEAVVFRTVLPGTLPDDGDFVEELLEYVPMDAGDCEELTSNLGSYLYGVLDQFQDVVIELLGRPWPVATDGSLATAYVDVDGEAVRLGFAVPGEWILDLGTISVPELGECDEAD